MIDVMRLSLFPKTIGRIVFSTKKKHNIIFYSENSTFMNTYSKLKIKRMHAKKVGYPPYKAPYLILDATMMKMYKELKLIPVKNLEDNKENIFIDTTKFLDTIDKRFTRQSYKRTPVVMKIIDYLNKCRQPDAVNVLLYHVDISKELSNKPFFRRSWILNTIADAGAGRFPFDCVIIAMTFHDKVKYFSIFNKNLKSLSYSKIFNIFKSIKTGKDVEEDEEIEDNEKEAEEELKKNELSSENLQEQTMNLDDLRNEDMLGDNKFTPTSEIIKQIQANKQVMESNKSFSKSSKILQRIYR